MTAKRNKIMANPLDELIGSLVSKKTDAEEMSSVSLRIPESLNTELEELSGQVDLTKSALITKFIEVSVLGLRQALDVKDQDLNVIHETCLTVQNSKDRFFLLNTNFNNDPKDHESMLQNAEAAAFYDHWKENIAYLKQGDHVFLYQSGVGFVAYGVVNSDLIRSDHHGKTNEKYARKLTDFTVGFKPVKARDFKDLTKSNTSFRQTMVGLTKAQGNALREEILRRANKLK